MSNKQYLRSIDEGDAAFEGRASNGISAKANGSTLLYSGVSKLQLEQLESQTDITNVSIDGNIGNIIAIIPANKDIDYPEGNNNKETVQSSTNPNKVTQANLNKPSNDENDWWIKEILEFEVTRGSSSGGGLSNWGYNSRIIPGNPPTDVTTGKDLKIEDAIEYFKQDILPKVQQYPLGLRERAADFLYNSGREPRVYYLDQYLKSIGQSSGLPNRGTYNVDTKTSGWTIILQNNLNAEWDKYKNDIDQLPLQQRIELLDKGRDFYYKNTYTDLNNWGFDDPPTNKKPKRGPDGSLAPPYGKSWKFRVTLLFKNPPSGQPTQPTPKTQPAGNPTAKLPQKQTPTIEQSESTPVLTTQTSQIPQSSPQLPIIQEENIPEAAPSEDEGQETENFTFLDETGVELDPVQIFEYTVGDQIVTPSAPIQNDLVEPYKPEEYKGSTNVIKLKPVKTTSTKTTTAPTKTTTKTTKTVLAEGVLVGTFGDVNQEINLPNPVPGTKGKLPDKYRGKIPVKEATYTSKLVSIQDMLKLFKSKGLTEQEARNMLTLTASEAARDDKSQPYFSGFNFNIFGIQAEAYWTVQYKGVKMSSYMAYRYIAKDDYGLRIFAGFNSLDDAVSAKIIACRDKGILTATDIDTFANLYLTKWVANKGTPSPAAVELTKSVYKSWGIKRFDQYKVGIY